MGFVAGRLLKVDQHSITQMLFYIVNPIVIFNNISSVKIDHTLIAIPIVYFLMCCSVCLFFYFLGKKLWDDDTKNILAFSAGTGNLGYMMLPIVYVFFGEELLVVFFLMIAGMSLYDNTLGFYISASGKYTQAQSIAKVIKIPSLYSFALAIIASKLEIKMPDSISVFAKNVSVMYSILGMMVIGLSVSNIKKFEIDFKLLSLCIAARYIVWPILTYGVVLLDRHMFHLYPETYHQLWMVVAFIPLGLNSLIVATLLNNKPEKITSALLITIASALIYIPLALKYFAR